MKIASQVTDRRLSAADRDTALSALERLDFDIALSLAPALVDEENRILRARAAWILAQADQDSGRHVLRAMAGEMTDESVLAIEALGRLRDAGSHELLRTLLQQELSRERPAAGRVSALTQALGDFVDKSDATLLGMAVRGKYGSGDWVMVEAVGRTGGKAAASVLEDIFARARGWTAMAAGLGLARCGSEKGLKYVHERLVSTKSDSGNTGEMTLANAETDDANSPKATAFVLDHFGVPADEAFVPDLLRVVARTGNSSPVKAQAWRALLRINAPKHRKEILEYAWKDLSLESAARFVALNDEAKARELVSTGKPEDESYEHWALRQALATTPRERLRWREVHGYSF